MNLAVKTKRCQPQHTGLPLPERTVGFVFIVCHYIPAPEQLAAGKASFDYDAFLAHFSGLQAFHKFDAQVTGALGFIFMETEEAEGTERAFLRDADLSQFCY